MKLVKVLSSLPLVASFSLLTLTSHAQQQQPKPEQSPDVVRVETNLVQSGMTVVDKNGLFVEGVRLEDLELRIDGKPRPILFLTKVVAGTAQERQQLEAARSPNSSRLPSSGSEEVGRTIVFFIDDLHLSAKSVQRTKDLISQFLLRQMASNDQVAIASTSGQIGFLQQFTDSKPMLRVALSRLNHKPYTITDAENIRMTEYAALRIDQGDRDVLTYFTNHVLAANNFSSAGGQLGPPNPGTVSNARGSSNQRSSGMSREMAERQVKERASVMLKQSDAITTGTLSSLESLMRSSAQRPGRKLLFFISDGFYLNNKNTGNSDKVREITSAALRSGVVIYSLDTRGMTSSVDAGSNRVDPESKLSSVMVGELAASQDPLNALAEDTGGRAWFNNDSLYEGLNRGINETSNYYVVAWRPDTEEQKSPTFKKIDISVVGRPELSVRRPKGYFSTPIPAPATPSTATGTAPKSADADLKAALTGSVTDGVIPTLVSTSFIDAPNSGLILTTSVQAATAALDYGEAKKANVDVAGVILNDQAKVVDSFKTRLTVTPLPENVSRNNSGVVYSHKSKLTPGLYQVRSAVRDERSGKVGVAAQWIEIPDLSSKRLTLSTLLLREQTSGPRTNAEGTEMPFSVDRRFLRTSHLGFFLFVYNASRGQQSTSQPDLTTEIRVLRRGQPVVSSPAKKLQSDAQGDLARIPYGGQFPLASLQPGRYEMVITITDKLANTSATQSLDFVVE